MFAVVADTTAFGRELTRLRQAEGSTGGGRTATAAERR
jgi:hypothetical protein